MPRNRSLPPHLEHRSSGYAWRRRVPRDLRRLRAGKPLERNFFCFSLRTHVLRDAKILGARLTSMSDQIFAAAAEKTMTIAPEMTTTLLTGLARFEIEAFERSRALAGPRCPEVAALDLQREAALQETLRRAIYLGDREAARLPLRNVAAHLGLQLDESDQDWTALAYEATKVLLDVSTERARRRQGLYDQPTVFFRRAVSTAEAPAVDARPVVPANSTAPATFAAAEAAPATAASDLASFAANAWTAAPEAPLPVTPQPEPEVHRDAAVSDAPAVCMSPVMNSTVLTQVIVPAGLERPHGYDDETWQTARIAARQPRFFFDKKLLSEATRTALKKQRGITLAEAIELYFELISRGYSAPFNRNQKRKPVLEDLKDLPLAERLHENYRGKYRLARDFWPDALGDEPVDEISVEDVNDALERLWHVPANHSKSQRDRDRFSLIEIIEKTDAKDAQLERDIKTAVEHGATAEDVDKMRLNRTAKRISVTTYINHGRVLANVGKMLMDMQLIDQNPFDVCTWTNDEERELKGAEGGRERQAWDDRIFDLFGSPIFQEPLADIGEPLFWAPLIARHQGMRMEEILQLGPDDFGTDHGIPYLCIRHTLINGVKTLSSARKLPIHPQLIELGLLKLVELRKKQNHIRLFPFLNRGKQKGTFSANFSKCFAYYRRTNECYWPGLDFHALRTTFHHDLLGDDKSDAIRCRLMGHSYTDEGDRSYGQNLGIEKLANRMESVVVDISMIRRPFDEPSAVVRARAQEKGLRVVG
ncbi:DUF6538 domain-containing protein [Pseudooceanicola nanhaiensis]|uniref:DUF6538 domain-containing protein n=1 Tax=Pseudooceanicola nanhaiensis TaxID=375761 RepID=UPI00351904EC